MPQVMRIDKLSLHSLRLTLFREGKKIGSATGFTISYKEEPYLITNWHVVTGVNPDTGECRPTPDVMRVIFRSHSLNQVYAVSMNMQVAGIDIWSEHPLGRRVDVVAIRLNPLPDEVKIFPLDLKMANADVLTAPAMPVSVIGYPFGMSAGAIWPIWKIGHIASDPDVNYEIHRPAFLIDATTRGGMSGSPVIMREFGFYRNKMNNLITDGISVSRFLGVYAGRIHDQSEIGRVWRPHVIEEILEQKLIQTEDAPPFELGELAP